MIENKAVIPLYLNSDIVKSLFTIVVAVYGKEKTINNKQQVTINAKIPISEVSYNILGKYVEGDLNIQTIKEFSKQNSEEVIFIDIEILRKLKNILEENTLIKEINTSKDIENIKENDFVEIISEIKENPVLEKAKETMKYLEMETAFQNSKMRSSNDIDNIKALNFFKDGIEECKKNKCIRYITDYIQNSNTRAIVPLEDNKMLVNSEYMLDGKVRIFGKVIKVCKGKEKTDINLFSGTYFDYINYDYFKSEDNKIFKGIKKETPRTIIEEQNECDFIEIIPIAIYI